MEENTVAIRKPETFYFYFDLPRDINKNMKHDIEFIIKSNESLFESKMKNQIEQLLYKYKHGNDTRENRKQQNE